MIDPTDSNVGYMPTSITTNNRTYYTNTSTNWQTRLSTVGSTKRNYLPLWMQSIQPETREELGFILAIPLCFCKVGTGDDIILNIKYSKFNFSLLDYTIDRFIIDSTAENNDDKYIIFNNDRDTILETSAVLKTNIVNLNPVNNDLDGSTINNGTYNEFYGIHHAATAASIDVAVTANLANGSIHTITLVNDVDVNFSGWPITGSYAKVRVHLTTASATPIAITDFTSIAATVKIATEFPSPILVNTNKHLVIEAWSYDGGDTIFVQYIGEF
jgi:hypothetical protein